MNQIEYAKHKKALVARAMLMSVEGLQGIILEELKNPSLPYLLFDATMQALEKKMGKKAFAAWVNNI